MFSTLTPRRRPRHHRAAVEAGLLRRRAGIRRRFLRSNVRDIPGCAGGRRRDAGCVQLRRAGWRGRRRTSSVGPETKTKDEAAGLMSAAWFFIVPWIEDL